MAQVNSAGAIQRVTREIAAQQKGDDLSIAVACKDSDVRHVRALIIGPPDSPYEFGFFEFDMKVGHDLSPTMRASLSDLAVSKGLPNEVSERQMHHDQQRQNSIQSQHLFRGESVPIDSWHMARKSWRGVE